MPYKHSLGEVLAMLFSNPPEALKTLGIMLLGAISRACLSSDNGCLKRLGDLICCVLMFYLVRMILPASITITTPLFTFDMPRGAFAIIISLTGSHVIYLVVKCFIKKKTGLDLKEKTQ